MRTGKVVTELLHMEYIQLDARGLKLAILVDAILMKPWAVGICDAPFLTEYLLPACLMPMTDC